MEKRKKSTGKKIIFGIFGFSLMFVLVFFGVQFFTKTGVFRIPGVVYYDESLMDDEITVLKNVFTEDVDLDKDVTITARNVLELPALSSNEFLYNIAVPVTDFYSTETDIATENADSLMTNCVECSYQLIDVNELDFNKKLLKINGEYYLDTFKTGAVFRIISFESEKYDEEIEPLVADVMKKVFPEDNTVLTLAQTGVTALSRGMLVKLNAVGGDATYFAENIKDFLSSFDLTHTSNESSFSSSAGSRNICSDKRFADTLTAIGLDIVELTGNHNQDCGDSAARDTIDWYNENNIRIVGGGKTATDAAIPLEIDQKGNNITMLAYNQSTGGATLDNTPGANQYYEDVAKQQIGEAKARGDFVIVDIQYYECSEYDYTYEVNYCDYANSSAGDQVGLFRHLIDLGADVVVGTSAHQPQTFELYGDGVIYYGLGNLFFDQVWWPGTTRSLVLVHHFYKDKLLQTEIVPTVYDNSMQTKLMDEETTKWFLNRLMSERP